MNGAADLSLRERLARSGADATAAITARPSRRAVRLVPLALVALAVVLLAPLAGPVPLSPARVFDGSIPPGENLDRNIFFTARVPRVLFGFIAGAALAMAGTVYQAVLRNDLAEPFTLGVAGAAAVGAVAAMALAPAALAGFAMPVASLGSCVLALAVIYGLARLSRTRPSPATILLAGISLNFLFGATILLIQYLSDPYQTLTLIRWLMGGLDAASYTIVVWGSVVLLAGAVALVLLAKAMNLLSVGDSAAHHLGVQVERTRLIALGSASALAALVVSFCGPIGFVGLIVPHILRRVVGADHRLLLPAALLGGGAFLVACDAIARTALSPAELPVGIVTAFLGAPFFLILLFRKA